MVVQDVNRPECAFCGTESNPWNNGRRRKLKLSDGTRTEGWLCEACDPLP